MLQAAEGRGDSPPAACPPVVAAAACRCGAVLLRSPLRDSIRRSYTLTIGSFAATAMYSGRKGLMLTALA